MITLEKDRLIFRFFEVHQDAMCSIHLQRTLRIPDDGKDYPLPPGLGAFPLRHLDDFARNVPSPWLKRGGVVMPMHQSEAMWICFGGEGYPFAVKIATGKINAVSGEPWMNNLNADPQDYVVLPKQPWIDGYCVERGVVRQFVAMPLGEGYTVEEQIAGAAEHGGVQIVVYPMKADRYERMKAERGERSLRAVCCEPLMAVDMGLAMGGRMKQKIYDDPYGLDAWDQRHSHRCFITIANSVAWNMITGERPPTMPPTAANYTDAGLPWFDYYDADAKALSGSLALAGVKSVFAIGNAKAVKPLPENESAEVERIINLRRSQAAQVRESSLDGSIAEPSSRNESQGPTKTEGSAAVRHEMWGYRDYILQALLDLGGHAHRSRVIKRVYDLRKQANATLPDSFDETVQQAFERHCRQSMIFCGRPALDLFSWPRGKHEGTWGVNKVAIDAYIRDRDFKYRRAPKAPVIPLTLDEL